MKKHVCKDSTANLCDSCVWTMSDCEPDHVEFGDGFGNDNVIECSVYDSSIMGLPDDVEIVNE